MAWLSQHYQISYKIGLEWTRLTWGFYSLATRSVCFPFIHAFSLIRIGLLAVTPIVGILSDKYRNRKIPMILGLIGLSIATLFFAYASTFEQLVIARMGQGVSGGVSWTIGLCMVADIYPSSQLGSVMSNVLSANSLGFLVGPPIGGFLFDYVGSEAPYLFCAGLAVFDLIGRFIIDSSAHKPLDIRESQRFLSEHPHPVPVEQYGSVHELARERTITNEAEVPLRRKVTMWTLVKDPQLICTCFIVFFGASVFSGSLFTFIQPSTNVQASNQPFPRTLTRHSD